MNFPRPTLSLISNSNTSYFYQNYHPRKSPQLLERSEQPNEQLTVVCF